MKYTPFFILTLLFLSVGCKQQANQADTVPWNTLTIISEGSTEIIINNYDDTSMIKIYPIVTIFMPRPKKKLKVDTVKAYFTLAEKDTLFKLAKDLIFNPVKTHGRCTEFIGHLELSINYGQFRQYGEYSSVCNWNTLSDKTMKLHNMLKKRIKGIYLGENQN
jgi:hypothetical protein